MGSTTSLRFMASRLFTSLPLFFSFASAACECGYSTRVASSNDGEQMHVFTDFLESDFLHLDITGDNLDYGQYGWAAQVFNMTADAARGPYGEAFVADNVIGNTIENDDEFEGDGQNGGPAGLQLVVSSTIRDDMVSNAEIATVDLHYYYGTFRAGMKVTDMAGTCSAFFWVS
jgi:hypothetical protein